MNRIIPIQGYYQLNRSIPQLSNNKPEHSISNSSDKAIIGALVITSIILITLCFYINSENSVLKELANKRNVDKLPEDKQIES